MQGLRAQFTPHLDELLKGSTKPPGNETVNGFVTKVYEAEEPKEKLKIKVWREAKTGPMVKADMTPPGGATSTLVETKEFSAAKSPASIFVLPGELRSPRHVPTAAERFATDTGDRRENFIGARRQFGVALPAAAAVRSR